MSGSERLDSKAGPLGNLSQAYFGSLDMMVKGCEPALKGVGRWNLELVGLLTRRSQAWLEVSARLIQCKTPMDLFNEQMRFWQRPPRITLRLASARRRVERLRRDAEAQRNAAPRLHDLRRAEGGRQQHPSAATARAA
jgi:hypothetical protein